MFCKLKLSTVGVIICVRFMAFGCLFLVFQFISLLKIMKNVLNYGLKDSVYFCVSCQVTVIIFLVEVNICVGVLKDCLLVLIFIDVSLILDPN